MKKYDEDITTTAGQQITNILQSVLADKKRCLLHEPCFEGKEKQYLKECIDSSYVSSVGKFVDQFEQQLADYTSARRVVAVVNGTSALQIALKLADVSEEDEVLVPALTFVATANAVHYVGATPHFVDCEEETLGIDAKALRSWLQYCAEKTVDGYRNRKTGKRIRAVLPMHTFGHPSDLEGLMSIAHDYKLILIEDASESLGSFYQGKHVGTFGKFGTLSFNGNKIITTGGGGAIITDNSELAKRAKYITTTAKVPHPYEFVHDEIGYNYRMPNLNAALGCAQMERLDEFLTIKAQLADQWEAFFHDRDVDFVRAINGNNANHWLNAIIFDSRLERDNFLKITNDNNVMTRPIWTLMSKLAMFKDCQTDGLENSLWLADRVVNIPSSIPDGALKQMDK